jgi:hypothetical protein
MYNLFNYIKTLFISDPTKNMPQHIKVRKSPIHSTICTKVYIAEDSIVKSRSRCNAEDIRDTNSHLSSDYTKMQANYSDDNEDTHVLSDSDEDLKTAMRNSLQETKYSFDDQNNKQETKYSFDDQNNKQADTQYDTQDDDQDDNQSLSGYVFSDSNDEFEGLDSDTDDLVNKYRNMFRTSNLQISFDSVDIMVYANIMTMQNIQSPNKFAEYFEIFKNQFSDNTWKELINTKFPPETIHANIIQLRMQHYINK